MIKSHGMTNTRLYGIWSNMKTRCYCKTDPHYKRWGGRGIQVCDEWKNSFTSFYQWAVENGYEDTLTIDRIDNDKNYEPSNCRWATLIEQANNTRNSRYYTHNGETHTMAEWSRILGINREVLKDRVFKLGWSFEEAVRTPKLSTWNHQKGDKNCKERGETAC